jgi:hypothetical protein
MLMLLPSCREVANMDGWVKKFTKHLRSGKTTDVSFDIEPKDFLRVKADGLEISIEVDEKKLKKAIIDLVEHVIFNALELERPYLEVLKEGVACSITFREDDLHRTVMPWADVAEYCDRETLEWIGNLFMEAAKKAESTALKRPCLTVSP